MISIALFPACMCADSWNVYDPTRTLVLENYKSGLLIILIPAVWRIVNGIIVLLFSKPSVIIIDIFWMINFFWDDVLTHTVERNSHSGLHLFRLGMCENKWCLYGLCASRWSWLVSFERVKCTMYLTGKNSLRQFYPLDFGEQ